MSKEFKKHLQSKSTKCELTVHDSPQQDWVSEHGMRTRAEHARALLIVSGLPYFLWAESMHHCVWLQNWLSTHCSGYRSFRISKIN
jgi:hypothetical protein